MTDFESTAGFRITSSKIQIVELSLKSGSIFIKDLNEVFFNEKINFQKDKETKISALLQGAYDEILLQNPLKNIFISFSLPQSLFYTMQIPFEQSMVYSELVEEFRWQFSLLYPFLNTQELLIQYYPIQQNEFSSGNLAYVSALPRNISNIFTRFCETNNLRMRFIDSSHNASDKALVTSMDIQNESPVLSMMVEDRNLSFIFYSYGESFLFSNKVFNNASEIPQLVNDELAQYNLQDKLKLAFISGDELSGSFIERLSEITKIPFSLFNPFSRLQVDQSVLDNKFYLLKNNSFSPAVGISIRSL